MKKLSIYHFAFILLAAISFIGNDIVLLLSGGFLSEEDPSFPPLPLSSLNAVFKKIPFDLDFFNYKFKIFSTF